MQLIERHISQLSKVGVRDSEFFHLEKTCTEKTKMIG